MSTCRYNKNLFPVMECLIDTYSETGRPVGFTAIQKCVGERHGRGHPEQVRRGLDLAHCLGYLRVVVGKYGSKYVPTLDGVVYTGVYTALALNLGFVDELPQHALFCLLRLVRSGVAMLSWAEAFNTLLEIQEGKDASRREILRRKLVDGLVAFKALLGIEVRGLEPRFYSRILTYIWRRAWFPIAIPPAFREAPGHQYLLKLIRGFAEASCG